MSTIIHFPPPLNFSAERGWAVSASQNAALVSTCVYLQSQFWRGYLQQSQRYSAEAHFCNNRWKTPMAQLSTDGWKAPRPPAQTEASSAPRTGGCRRGRWAFSAVLKLVTPTAFLHIRAHSLWIQSTCHVFLTHQSCLQCRIQLGTLIYSEGLSRTQLLLFGLKETVKATGHECCCADMCI